VLNHILLDFLVKLVKTPSENPYSPDISSSIEEPIERQVAELIFNQLEKYKLQPIQIYKYPTRPNIVCSINWNSLKNFRGIIFNWHMDTVPVWDLNKWQYHPFSWTVKDWKLYWRWALDMKWGLVAIVYTLVVLKQLWFNWNVMWMFVVDEEPGAYSEIWTKYVLDRLNISKSVAVVCEPWNKNICIWSKWGYRFIIKVKWQSTHSWSKKRETKQYGINAIEKAAEIILRLKDTKFPKTEIELFKERQTVLTPTIIKWGVSINVVPDSCEIFIDMRILPWQTKQLLKKIIFDALTWYDIEIKDILYVPAVCIDKDDEIVNILQNTTNEVLGYTPWVKISWPWCDSHFFIERGIPAISWFWPEWENMHGYNEYVYIDSVIDMVKIYVLSVLNYFYN